MKVTIFISYSCHTAVLHSKKKGGGREREEKTLNKNCIFFKGVLPSFQYSKLNGASVTSISQVHVSFMLLLIAGN
jgi:hypothetical protein